MDGDEDIGGGMDGLYGLDEGYDTGLDTGEKPSSGLSFEPRQTGWSNWSIGKSGVESRTLRGPDEYAYRGLESDPFADIRERLKNSPSDLAELDKYDYKTLTERASKNADRQTAKADAEEKIARELSSRSNPNKSGAQGGQGGGGGRTSSRPIITQGPRPEPNLHLPFNVQMPVAGSGVKKSYYDVVREMLNSMAPYFY